jgi:glycosyltransferase involved in cell wall biosynthesis
MELCGDRRDITLVNEHWTHELVASLFLDIDVYVSPHRSEGYGLTVAHALAHDRYVITTAYGGPVDFTSSTFSGQVPYKMVRVGPNAVYPENAQWAEPDISAGAELMRNAAQDVARTQDLGRMGGDHARTTFTVDRAARWVAERIGPVDL